MVDAAFETAQPWVEEQHTIAWEKVADYMGSTLRVFSGRSADAAQTIMPQLAQWVEESLADLVEVREADDHGVILWANLPLAGILGVHKKEWVVSCIANMLLKYKRNSIAIQIHPNRASQQSGTALGSNG